MALAMALASVHLISSLPMPSTTSFLLRHSPPAQPCGTKLCTSPGKILQPNFGFAANSSPVLSRGKGQSIAPVFVVGEALVGEVEPASEDLKLESATEELSSLKSESDLLKKRVKRAELRRKRLVRKRRLRKKGRWPPSKMAKNKNV